MDTNASFSSSVDKGRGVLSIIGALIGIAICCAILVIGIQSKSEWFGLALVIMLLGGCLYALLVQVQRLRFGHSISVDESQVVIRDGKRLRTCPFSLIESIEAEVHSSFIVYRLKLASGEKVNIPPVAKLREVIDVLKKQIS